MRRTGGCDGLTRKTPLDDTRHRTRPARLLGCCDIRMADSLRAYRQAIDRFVRSICMDRNLDPDSTVTTESNCRIDQFLPELVELAKVAGAGRPDTFNALFEETICKRCGQLDALGTCPVREQAACCLYRYLPIIYDAISHVEHGRP